jgi:FAD/FMN-containing dehydrogenase
MPESWEGWEDSAVPPHLLGDYLRDLLSLFAEYGYERPALYGHFGHGCVHIRMPFRLKTGPGVRRFREFLYSAADLVTPTVDRSPASTGTAKRGVNCSSACSVR